MSTFHTMWKKLTSCQGNARRREFWAISLAAATLTVALILAIWYYAVTRLYGPDLLIFSGIGLVVSLIGYVAVMIPVSLRRGRDAGLPQKTYFCILGASLALSILTLSTILTMLAWMGMLLWLAFAPSDYLKQKNTVK
ncbi:DUF805 domain-containing protein [Epibacterium sp. DP7N7-1]|nr:DUF805 domain-containing protein [Epibacterium sp. DP7N7-1]